MAGQDIWSQYVASTPLVERYDGRSEHHFAVSEEPLDWQVFDNKVKK